MKALKWFGIIILGLPLALILGIYVRNKSVGPAGWAEDNTIKQLKLKMKDPDSMVIRSSYVVQKTDKTSGDVTIAICGVVDAKNSFGGYSGGSRFMSRSVDYKSTDSFDTYEVILEDSEETKLAENVHMLSGFDKVYWNPHCVDDEHLPVLSK